MTRDSVRARTTILDAGDRLLRRGQMATVEEVAREAGCAKGLVHYHFKTKAALLAAVAARLGERRRHRWAEAFQSPSPEAAIAGSWNVLVSESRDGTIRAWTVLWSQTAKQTGRAVSNELARFSEAVAAAARRLLADLRLVTTVSEDELGLLLAAVVHGVGLQLESGMNPERLQGAYAAAWLGVLSLTRRAAG